MKILNLIILLFIAFNFVQAQVDGGTNEKLEKLYLKEQYENCMFKAVDYTYNDNYKKDPEVYLYAAMSFYQLHISEDPDIQEDYPNALKDAMKYLLKFKKKDKDLEFTNQNVSTLKTILAAYFEEAVGFYKMENYKKAAYNFKQLATWYIEDNADLMFLYSVCQAVNGKSTAAQDMQNAIAQLKANNSEGKLYVKREIKEIFSDSFLKYAGFLIENEEQDSANATLNLGLELLPGNINIKSQIDSLKN